MNKHKALVILFQSLCISIANSTDPSDDAVSGLDNEQDIIYITELLSIGVDTPNLKGKYKALGKFILGDNYFEKNAGKMSQKGLSQMTILGAELSIRHKGFFTKLNANNIVTKIDDSLRARDCSLAHLRGMGFSYESMKDVDLKTLITKANLPPFKYIKHNWKKKLIEWQEKYTANQHSTNKNIQNELSSKFVLKSEDENYNLLNKRNSLKEVNGMDEKKYLYNTASNCKNIKNENFYAGYNTQDAKYSQIAKTFHEETKKMNKGVMPIEQNGNTFLFYGESKGKDGSSYDYKNLDAVSKLCLYDWEVKRGLNASERKCSNKLIDASKRLQKYHVYGIHSLKTQRMKHNQLLKELYEAVKSAKKKWESSDLKLVAADPFEEKFRLYISKKRNLIGPMVQLLGSAQPKEIYSPIIVKSSNLDELNYLKEAPRRASSMMIFLKNKTTRINNIPTKTLVVDIRYNGIIVNYCDTQDMETGCTYEEFESKIRRLFFGKIEFYENCFQIRSIGNKVAFAILLVVVLIILLLKCIKSYQNEKKKEIQRVNLATRELKIEENEEGKAIAEIVEEDTLKENLIDVDIDIEAGGNDESSVAINVDIEPEDVVENGDLADAEIEVEVEPELAVEVEVEVVAE